MSNTYNDMSETRKRVALVKYLIRNEGKPEDVTWSELALQFNVADPEQFNDPGYREIIRKKVHQWWRWYEEYGRATDSYAPDVHFDEDTAYERPSSLDPDSRRFRRMFYDIETAPCIGTFWRPGWKLRITPESIIQPLSIICISYKWHGEDEVYRLTWDDGDDREMLLTFVEETRKAHELVAHNGDGFDMPIIRTRCLHHGIDMSPFQRTQDTLKRVKRRFKFESNRLDDIGQELGVGRKIKTDYSMWKKLAVAVLFQDFDEEYHRVLAEMGTYCDEDVRLLERVYDKISAVIPHSTNAAVLMGGYKWQCPNCASDYVKHKNLSTTPMGTIKHYMQCQEESCQKEYTISNRTYIQMLTDRKDMNGKELLKYRLTS